MNWTFLFKFSSFQDSRITDTNDVFKTNHKLAATRSLRESSSRKVENLNWNLKSNFNCNEVLNITCMMNLSYTLAWILFVGEQPIEIKILENRFWGSIAYQEFKLRIFIVKFSTYRLRSVLADVQRNEFAEILNERLKQSRLYNFTYCKQDPFSKARLWRNRHMKASRNESDQKNMELEA